MLMSPLKKSDTGPRPRAASVEPPRLEITDFQKMDVYARCLAQCYRQHHVIKVLISRTWQRHFLLL